MLFAPKEKGQGLVEYALILVLVAVVVIVILALLGPAVGNIFSNITNSTIINESDVKESFNKIAREQDDATAKAFLLVAEEIEKSKNTEAGALFHTFNTELQKNNSSKTVLKTLWEGIVRQLPHINTMVGVVEKITGLFL